MTPTVYEGLFILDANHYSTDPEGTSGQITRTVEEAGGEMLHSKRWDERTLAYPIKGHRRAIYWLAYFRFDSERLKELSQNFQGCDSVLRFLFLTVDPGWLIRWLITPNPPLTLPIRPSRRTRKFHLLKRTWSRHYSYWQNYPLLLVLDVNPQTTTF